MPHLKKCGFFCKQLNITKKAIMSDKFSFNSNMLNGKINTELK